MEKLQQREEMSGVCGAKQMGKMYSIDEFARENYGHYLYIDLHVDAETKRIFK